MRSLDQSMPFESVAQSMPHDVVREFFQPFATGGLLVCRNGTASQFPWYLGHICSSWRAVFLSMHHEFWSEIRFASRSPQECIGRYTDIVVFFLQTGRNLPISFEFIEGFPLPSVLDALMAHSERWLNASFEYLQHSFLPLEGRLPLLRSLAIKKSINVENHDIFRHAHNLTHLSIAPEVISSFNFNWSAITVLELAGLRIYSHFIGILSDMKSLEKLLVTPRDRFEYGRGEIRRGEGSDAITLPHLKVLATVGSMTSLLSFIKTPVLEGLYIDTKYDLTSQEQLLVYGICSHFFETSPCDRLTRLTIYADDQTFVKHILGYTPHVQILGLMFHESGAIYDYLTCSSGQAPLLPLMQELHTYCTGEANTWCLRLQAMIESRTKSTRQCFKDLVFIFDEPGVPPESVFRVMKPICKSNLVQFSSEACEEGANLPFLFLHGPWQCYWPWWMHS